MYLEQELNQPSSFGGRDVEHLTKDLVLRHVSEYQIFKFYCKNFIELNKRLCSDLRIDNKPSCCIKMYNNGLYYKDFGTDESYNCFSYIRQYMKIKFNQDLNFNEILKVIINDLGLIKKIDNKKLIPSLNYVGLPDKFENKNTVIKIKRRNWNYEDIYWDQYYLTKDILCFYGVIPISNYWISKNNSELFLAYSEKKDDPAYSYEHGNGLRKILRPYDIDNKWISNLPRNIFSGWQQLDKIADLLIVTKSLKDCMVWRLFNINAISPQSESIFLNENQFDLLKLRFKKIIINYDNDVQGLKSMDKFSNQFNIDKLIIPEYKDISDYIKYQGYDKTKNLINNII